MAARKNIGSSRSTDVRQFRSPTDRSAVTRMLPPRFACRFQSGDTLNLGLSAQAELAFMTPTWVPSTKLFGGQPVFSLTVGGGWEQTSVIDLAWGRVPCELRPTERENHEAIGDVTPAQLRSGGCCRCVVRPVGDGRVFTNPGVVG